jgi:hypothetical protein
VSKLQTIAKMEPYIYLLTVGYGTRFGIFDDLNKAIAEADSIYKQKAMKCSVKVEQYVLNTIERVSVVYQREEKVDGIFCIL